MTILTFISNFLIFLDLGIQYDQSTNFLISLLFPVRIYICIFTLFFAMEVIGKKYRFYRLIIAFIIINIFIQPSLVIEGFKGLDCTTLYDNRVFLTLDLRMECFTSEYYNLVIFCILNYFIKKKFFFRELILLS